MLNSRTMYFPSLPFLCSLISVSLVALYGCKQDSPMINNFSKPEPKPSASATSAPPMITPVHTLKPSVPATPTPTLRPATPSPSTTRLK